MILAADTMKDERKNNSEILPVDTQGNNIEVIKEQILDLNDKFDFLVTLMLKGNKMST